MSGNTASSDQLIVWNNVEDKSLQLKRYYNASIDHLNKLLQAETKDFAAIEASFKDIMAKYTQEYFEKANAESAINQTYKLISDKKNQEQQTNLFLRHLDNQLNNDKIGEYFSYQIPKDKPSCMTINGQSNYSLTALSNDNSKVFKVALTNGAPPYILKISPCHAPTIAAHQFLQKKPELSVAKHYTRPILYKTKMYSVTVEECASNNLANYFKQSTATSQEESFKQFKPVFEQMVDVFLQMKYNNIVFTDPKNSNWLICDGGTLKLSDVKSLRNTSEDSDYYKFYQGTKYWKTKNFNSKKHCKQCPTNNHEAEQEHLYVLAKNIMEALGVQNAAQIKDNILREQINKCLDMRGRLKTSLLEFRELVFGKICKIENALSKQLEILESKPASCFYSSGKDKAKKIKNAFETLKKSQNSNNLTDADWSPVLDELNRPRFIFGFGPTKSYEDFKQELDIIKSQASCTGSKNNKPGG